MRRPLRGLLIALPLFFSSAGSTLAQATAYGVRLTLSDPEGDWMFLVGDRIRRDGDSGELRLEGGIQVRGTPDLLLLAEDMVLVPTTRAQDTSLTEVSQVASLRLRGQVFVQSPAGQVQAEEVILSDAAQGLRAFGSPVLVRVGDQRIESFGEVHGDLSAQTFTVKGGATVVFGEVLLHAERLDIGPTPINPQRLPALVAEGSVDLWTQDVHVRTGRIETFGEDADKLWLSNGVTVISSTGQIQAGSAWFDLQTRDFSLDRPGDQPIRAQGAP